MHTTAPAGLTGLFALGFGVVWIGCIALSFALPYLAVSAALNIRRGRKALERIADALDSAPRGPGGGVLGL